MQRPSMEDVEQDGICDGKVGKMMPKRALWNVEEVQYVPKPPHNLAEKCPPWLREGFPVASSVGSAST